MKIIIELTEDRQKEDVIKFQRTLSKLYYENRHIIKDHEAKFKNIKEEKEYCMIAIEDIMHQQKQKETSPILHFPNKYKETKNRERKLRIQKLKRGNNNGTRKRCTSNNK